MVDALLTATAASDTRVFVGDERGKPVLHGAVSAYDREGKLLSVELEWADRNRGYMSTPLDEQGIPLSFRVRHRDRFKLAQVSKIDFRTLTQHRLAKLTLADEIPAPTPLELPPWGETVGGCRMRVRMAKNVFRAREPVRVHFQAESDRSTADLVWINRENQHRHQTVLVDDHQARVLYGVIADEHVYSFPFQGTITLSMVERLPPGEHRLQYVLRGDAGKYKLTDGRELRKFDGELISNEVAFEVLAE